MKRKLMLSALLVVGTIGLSGCGPTSTSTSTNKTSSSPTSTPVSTPINTSTGGGNITNDGSVTPNTTVRERTDNREAVYQVYSNDGTALTTHASLYEAINTCVNEGDINDYVTKIGDATKLFVNYEKYSEGTADMFWYYENGTSLAEYTPWCSTYWQDLHSAGDIISVFKESATGIVKHYANSYTIANPHSDPTIGLTTTQVWNTCWQLEANATVDMQPYSGITKAEYTVDLSEARIYPSYENGDHAWAYVGFITADGYNTSNIGLRCDTTTGNWYYYSGETGNDTNNIVIEEDECYLTSTWDETLGCYKPDGDVKLTMELLTLVDDEGDDYIVHRLTADFGDNRVIVKDYEIAELTQCGTVRFTSGLDIESDNDLVDYMCGAKFENLVVTKAEATIYEEMQDILNYGNVPVIEQSGTFDILNSNPETVARYHTIVYNPSSVDYDFSTAGKDVYNYSFELNTNNPALSTEVTAVIEAIDNLPDVVTSEHKDQVTAARALYNGLANDYQRALVTNYETLVAAEAAADAVVTPDLKYTYLDKNNQEAGGDKFDVKVSEDGTYTFTQNFIQWGRVTLSFDGEQITTDNTTITGAFGGYGDAGCLYTDGDNFTFLAWEAKARSYTFVYNAEEKTLVITANRVSIEGLSYDLASNDPAQATYDSETGNWTLTNVVFQQWNSILFYYDNVEVNLADLTITGKYVSGGADWTDNLYSETGANKIYCCVAGGTAYNFVYNHTNKTLDISLYVEENTSYTATITPTKFNEDSGGDAIAVYTEGAVRSDQAWVGSGWRLYLVVDAEGRIAYMVVNPSNGYGGPNGTSYYANSYYSDYTTNPAINILDGFGPWVQGGTAHNLFDIKVPEGGFALVSHGTGTAAIFEALHLTSTGDADINQRGILDDSFRLVLNEDNTVTVNGK